MFFKTIVEILFSEIVHSIKLIFERRKKEKDAETLRARTRRRIEEAKENYHKIDPSNIDITGGK